MTADEWKKVADIYSAAIERPPEDRLKFASQACKGDETLESEVRRLLEVSETEEGFLEKPLSLIAGVLPQAEDFAPLLQTGDVLCDRFEIVRFIAHGGMGEVYEAQDRVLHEPSAIKTIRPEIASHPRIVEQFKQEVRRNRAIRSDHVCPAFDVFTDRSFPDPLIFFSMQLLQGETLAARIARRGPLEVSEALVLLNHVAEGLDAAHREEIVHGDLKSGNVMLVRTRSGALSASITDFGLARQVSAGIEKDEEVEPETQTAAGTPDYMSPEQLNGSPPTHASDVYALGLIAFEMVTGQLPFEGSTSEKRALKRLHELPLSPRSLTPSLPPSWDNAIRRCLSLAPEQRYSTAAEFLKALEASPPQSRARLPSSLVAAIVALIALAPLVIWFGFFLPRTPALPHSVAVLPFTPMNAHQGRDYFADAFTEDLTHTLARLKALQVVGTEGAMQVGALQLSSSQTGARLGVNYLLSGSIRRAKGKLYVVARLIRAPDGQQVWSRNYDRDENQIAEIRNEITRQLATKLHVSLAGMDGGTSGTSGDLKAQDLYWMGRHLWRRRSDADLRRSLIYFEQATARDPSFATSWSGLADVYSVFAERNIIAPSEALQKASHAARKALSLDPQLAEAWVSLGQVTSLYDRNFYEAERCFRQALQISPRLGTALQWYSYLLVKQRRFRESIGYARQAVEVEPFAFPANINLASVLYYAREDEQALQQCRKITEMEPVMFGNHLVAAQILARRGQLREAIAEMEQVRETAKAHPLTIRFWAELYAIVGQRKEALEAMSRLIAMREGGRVPASYIASAWGMLGEREKALDWLETAYREHDGLLSIMHAAPGFDAVRTDARYLDLLGRLGITAGMPRDSARIR